MSETTWWAAREAAAGIVVPGATHRVSLVEAAGRTLAADVRAAVDLPGFPTAAMDGWVVAGEGPWTVVGSIDTGVAPEGSLSPGQAMRIATGGLVPSGATAVLPWEVASMQGDRLDGALPDKLHIRPPGEECALGELLARRGDAVNPALLGLLGAAGIDEVEVFARPRVAVVILGDEVITEGLPAAGQVRDALGVQLPAWIDALGGTCGSISRVPDDRDALVGRLQASTADADMVVVTGGTERGHRDFLRSALEDIGATFGVDGVAVRPGHPMMLAASDRTPIIGLPGNPLSALVGLATLVQPMLDSWFDRADRGLPEVQMGQGVAPSRKELTRLMVGRIELGGFREVSHVSSAMLRGIAHADGWAVIPAQGVRPGDAVPWIPVPWIRRTG